MTLKEFSSKGGKSGKGKSKARTSEQATAAINERWAKYRAEKKAGLKK